MNYMRGPRGVTCTLMYSSNDNGSDGWICFKGPESN